MLTGSNWGFDYIGEYIQAIHTKLAGLFLSWPMATFLYVSRHIQKK